MLFIGIVWNVNCRWTRVRPESPLPDFPDGRWQVVAVNMVRGTDK